MCVPVDRRAPSVGIYLRAILLASVAAADGACGDSAPGIDFAPGTDFAPGSDFAAGTDLAVLCTTIACAASPCTAGCTFTAPTKGDCGSGGRPVVRRSVEACPGFCGFLTLMASPYGCRRFRSEDHCCTSDCHCYGSWSCWPAQSDVDYMTGGAICNAGFNCMSGAAPADMAPSGACLDSGEWQMDH